MLWNLVLQAPEKFKAFWSAEILKTETYFLNENEWQTKLFECSTDTFKNRLDHDLFDLPFALYGTTKTFQSHRFYWLFLNQENQQVEKVDFEKYKENQKEGRIKLPPCNRRRRREFQQVVWKRIRQSPSQQAFAEDNKQEWQQALWVSKCEHVQNQ